MDIAIIGTGRVAQALGQGWAAAGHSVIYGSRDPQGAADLAANNDSRVTTIAGAAAAAPVVALAVPYGGLDAAVTAAGDLAGKTVIDCTNPIAPGLQLAVGKDSSGAEQLAARIPEARVVKAFNSTGAENMADPLYDGAAITMFICGDDAAAKATTTVLAEDLGFEVADVGPLSAARFIEPLALVWIRLAMAQGWGRNIAFKVVRR